MQDISDCLSLEAQHVAEARLAAKRAARAEAREIRMKELERQQKEVEERSDKDFGEKDSLAEVEEKYKRSMVTNAQLDNEKTSLQYQVDTLREVLLEFEEELAESRRQYEEKHKECERQKHDQNVLRFQLAEMKEALEQRESLLTKHGIILDSVGTPNGDASLEPHVNADGRPDPPIRVTSMGPSEEKVEKKENMSVVGEIPPCKSEQDKQEVLLTAPSETQLNSEGGDEKKEQNIQEITSNFNDVTLSEPNLEHQGEGLPLEEGECAPENLNSEVSEVHTEAAVDQRDMGPVEIEIFQDALDNILQSACESSQRIEGSTVAVGECSNKDDDLSPRDFKKEEDTHEVQNTSIESHSNALEILVGKANAPVSPDDTGDHYADAKDELATGSPDHSSQEKSEESIADESTSRAVEQEKVKPEEQSVPVELGLQSMKDDLEKTDSDSNYTSTEKESVSAETAIPTDIRDVVEDKKTDLLSELSPQDIQFKNEKKQIVESENFGEVLESCIVSNLQSTVNEALKDSEVLEDSIPHLEQHKDTTDAGKPNADLDAPGNESLDKGKHDNLVCDKSEKTNVISLDAPSTELSDERKQDKICDHPVCDQSKNINEKTNLICLDASGKELLDNGKQDAIPDHTVCEENTCDNPSVVAEIPKETVPSEIFSSDGDSTPEGEESDDNNDNEEDMAVRSEKYTGESLPLGSSVDQASTDDIRMEDSSDKARKGKGKNKEDCVVS